MLNSFLNKILSSNQNADTSANISMTTRSRSRNNLRSIPENTEADLRGTDCSVTLDSTVHSNVNLSQNRRKINHSASTSRKRQGVLPDLISPQSECMPAPAYNNAATPAPPSNSHNFASMLAPTFNNASMPAPSFNSHNNASVPAPSFNNHYSASSNSASLPLAPKPLFAVPTARAPRAQINRRDNVQDFLNTLKWFRESPYVPPAERDYILNLVAVHLMRKISEKYHSPMICQESKRSFEHLLAYFVDKGVMSSAKAEMILSHDTMIQNFEVGSIDGSMLSRAPSVSGLSNASYHPYRPLYPRNMNYPLRNGFMNSQMSNPRWTGGSNDSRFSSYEPMYPSQPPNHSFMPPAVSRLQVNKPTSTTPSVKSTPLGINTNVNNVCDSTAASAPPPEVSVTVPKKGTAAKENRSSSHQVITEGTVLSARQVKQTPAALKSIISPVGKTNKRKREHHRVTKKPVTQVTQRNQLDDSIANQSITRSGRISKPVSKYWDL